MPLSIWPDLTRGLVRRPLGMAMVLAASVLLHTHAGPPHAPPAAATTTRPALTLAMPYQASLPLTDYWVSEKYDGIRALWTGHQLLTRQGHPIAAPQWFTAHWPHTPMDGELWAGRQQFAVAQSAVAMATPTDAMWKRIRYMVFDLPTHTGPFTERQQALQHLVQTVHQPWLQAAPQWQVHTHAQLQQQLKTLTQAGAEGLMLRHAHAPYRSGRSGDLIKLKLWEDAEAIVTAHLPGQGKYAGMTGALEVQLPTGQRMRLGSGLSDAERRHPPPIGSTVTYRFNGLHASGLPRFARFWRVRVPEGPPPPTAALPPKP